MIFRFLLDFGDIISHIIEFYFTFNKLKIIKSRKKSKTNRKFIKKIINFYLEK